MTTINLYVSQDFQEFYDQLKVIAEGNNKSYAGLIGKAVKKYIQDLNDETPLLADTDVWNKFLRNATKEEMIEVSTLICNLNNKIIRKCQK